MIIEGKKRAALIEVTALAKHYSQGPLPVHDLSDDKSLSISYIEQLFAPLRDSALVVGVRGPGGGYMLARPPQNISVDEILRALDSKEDKDLAPLESAYRDVLKKFTLDRLVS